MDIIRNVADDKAFRHRIETIKETKAAEARSFAEDLERVKKDLAWEERRRRELEGCQYNEREMRLCLSEARHVVRKERKAQRISLQSASMLLKALAS